MKKFIHYKIGKKGGQHYHIRKRYSSFPNKKNIITQTEKEEIGKTVIGAGVLTALIGLAANQNNKNPKSTPYAEEVIVYPPKNEKTEEKPKEIVSMTKPIKITWPKSQQIVKINLPKGTTISPTRSPYKSRYLRKYESRPTAR